MKYQASTELVFVTSVSAIYCVSGKDSQQLSIAVNTVHSGWDLSIKWVVETLSLQVDKFRSSWGLSWCAPGQQPIVKYEILGYSGLSDVVNKLNWIFKVSFQFCVGT